MRQSRMVEEIRAVRQRLYEEEKRLGRDEFVRRQRERVREFLQKIAPRLLTPEGAAPPER